MTLKLPRNSSEQRAPFAVRVPPLGQVEAIVNVLANANVVRINNFCEPLDVGNESSDSFVAFPFSPKSGVEPADQAVGIGPARIMSKAGLG